MEDFDSLNDKQLESLERGLSDLKHNRVMTSDEFWKGLLKKEQQELLDEAYVYYEKEILQQRKIQREKVQKLRSQGKRIKVAVIPLLSQEEFINKCKTDTEFSEKWGLTIEERELSLEERATIWNNTHNPAGNIFTHNQYDENNIPKRAISLRYNHKTITSYE
jgi:hypothetical protein